MRGLSILGLTFACLSGAAAGMSQDVPDGDGTRLRQTEPALAPNGRLSKVDEGRIVTQRFAACLVEKHGNAVATALQPEAWEDGPGKKVKDLVDPSCLYGGTLAMPDALLRGALYQQLYRKRFAWTPPAKLSEPVYPDPTTSAKMTADARQKLAVRQFGDCVARRDLRDAHLFILASPSSTSETAALTALLPHFSACITRGSTWTLNRSFVSAILSEVLYREAEREIKQAL